MGKQSKDTTNNKDTVYNNDDNCLKGHYFVVERQKT